MAHLQYHAYGGDDWTTMRSETAQLAEYFNAHPNFTTDAGAVLFGDTVTITADGPWQHLLYKLTGRKWGNLDVENETGCGIVPYTYRPSNLVNAVQWAAGLELLLLIDDPWRVFLSTDHPNGACFWRYPEIIQLLMCADFRRECIARLTPQGRSNASRCRSSIASTRCTRSPRSSPPARPGRWDCRRKDIWASAPTPTWSSMRKRPTSLRMFSHPRYVIKGGEIVIEEGDIRATPQGREFLVKPAYDRSDRNLSAADVRRPVHDVVRELPGRDGTAGTPRNPRLHPSQMSTLRLTLKDQPAVPIEAEVLSPDVLAGLSLDEIRATPVYLGKRRRRIDELFDVEGEPGDELELHGDLHRVKWLGRGMTRGRLTVHGNAGMHLGSHMKGGEIEVHGNAGDWVGAEMTGGSIHVRGNAGGQVGAAYRGSLAGMRNGMIVIDGSVGLEIGMRMRRGTIVIGGPRQRFRRPADEGGHHRPDARRRNPHRRLDGARHDHLARAAAFAADLCLCRLAEPRVSQSLCPASRPAWHYAALLRQRRELRLLLRRQFRAGKRRDSGLAAGLSRCFACSGRA